jgi:hypothetical protein
MSSAERLLFADQGAIFYNPDEIGMAQDTMQPLCARIGARAHERLCGFVMGARAGA